jgi:hypothetical protein
VKHAISISLGSSKRDQQVEIELCGEKVMIERRGVDGDLDRASEIIRDLDGKVDAIGIGGTNLTLRVEDRIYTLHSVARLVEGVSRTPVVDGSGLKATLEARAAAFLEARLPDFLARSGRTALITAAVDRWGLAASFENAGYECVFGDLMFGLDLPLPLRSLASVRRLAAWLLPVATRVPFHWLYPTGEKQDSRRPKWQAYYHWATVIVGDRHYVARHMPDGLKGKIVVTNTTTPDDVALFRQAGVRYLITTTPVLEGRSFGTNMIEAALVAVAAKGRPLESVELEALLAENRFEPVLRELD